MATSYSRIAGLSASAALAALTIGVFAANQQSGPEGSLHKYLDAVLHGDQRAATKVVIGTEPLFFDRWNFFRMLFSNRGTYRVADVVLSDGTARAGVIFSFPNGAEFPLVISLRRVRSDWYVDLARIRLPFSRGL